MWRRSSPFAYGSPLQSWPARRLSGAAVYFNPPRLGEKHHSRPRRYSQSLIFSALKCANLTDATRSRCELANKSASSLISALRCDSPRRVSRLELIDINHHLRKKHPPVPPPRTSVKDGHAAETCGISAGAMKSVGQ